MSRTIVSVQVGDIEDTFAAGKWLFDRGYYVQSATYPAVGLTEGLLRVQVNANHSAEQIDGLLSAIADLKRHLSCRFDPRSEMAPSPDGLESRYYRLGFIWLSPACWKFAGHVPEAEQGLRPTTRRLDSLPSCSASRSVAACMALAIRTLPLGTGYAVWTGIGVIGTTTAGIWLFHEPASPLRLVLIAS